MSPSTLAIVVLLALSLAWPAAATVGKPTARLAAPMANAAVPRLPRSAVGGSSQACCGDHEERLLALEGTVAALAAATAPNHVMVTSTGAIILDGCVSPTLIPGLDLEIEVEAGASLVVLFDAPTRYHCSSPGSIGGHKHSILLELDGDIVAAKTYGDTLPTGTTAVPGGDPTVALNWLSPRLAPGAHHVRALLTPPDGPPGAPCHLYRTTCYGSSTPDDGYQARLIAIEIR